MPNGYLAKCLRVSLATVFRFKKETEDAGFIETIAGFSYLVANSRNKAKKEPYETMKYIYAMEGLPNRFEKR